MYPVSWHAFLWLGSECVTSAHYVVRYLSVGSADTLQVHGEQL